MKRYIKAFESATRPDAKEFASELVKILKYDFTDGAGNSCKFEIEDEYDYYIDIIITDPSDNGFNFDIDYLKQLVKNYAKQFGYPSKYIRVYQHENSRGYVYYTVSIQHGYISLDFAR